MQSSKAGTALAGGQNGPVLQTAAAPWAGQSNPSFLRTACPSAAGALNTPPGYSLHPELMAFASHINQSLPKEQIQVMPFHMWCVLCNEQVESKF